MDSDKLAALIQSKHEAVRAYREAETGTDSEARAWAGYVEADKAIDEALVESIQAREADEARAKFEANTRTDPVKAELAEKRNFNTAVRRMLNGSGESIALPMGAEARAGEEMITSTSDTTDYAFYNIATKMHDRLVFHRNAQSGILRAQPTIIRTKGDGPFDIPKLSTDAASSTSPDTEASATAITNPVFGKTTLGSYRTSGYMEVSDEMLRSPDYDFAAVLYEIAARALATQEAIYLARGTGSSQPQGLFPGATAGITGAVATVVEVDELKQLMYKPIEGYRAVGSFLLSSAAMAALALAKDTTDQYLWQPSNIAGQPNLLWGRPCIEEAHADANNAIAASEVHAVFGDIGAFWVRYCGNVVIEASSEFHFTAFTKVIRFAEWLDSDYADSQAIYKLTQHA